MDTENQLVVAREEGDEGISEIGEADEEVQTSSSEISHRDVMYT